MKRSEIILKVQKDLMGILNNSPKFTNRCTDEEALSIILDLFETYGMLPPDNCSNGNCNKHDFNTCGNQWEPE